MRIAIAALLLAEAAWSQQPGLWLDLSGPWRIQFGDEPEQTLQLPLGRSDWFGRRRGADRKAWLRKQVTLPAWADRAQMSLTLGAVEDIYEGQGRGGFVTCCCARIDSSGAMVLASAGHPTPYLDECEIALEPGLPLGLAADARYSATALRIESGSQMTFISDGVLEAANAAGELFGFERTRAIARRQAAEIAATAKAWGQNDDVTVVTVRRKAP